VEGFYRTRSARSDCFYDAVLIGGGPAGAAASAILAEHGHRVLVLERERFPRYHIGESLLPFTYGPLERLGMIPKMRQSCFVKKYSASFVQPDGRSSQPFYFFNRYDRETVAQSWQVLRSEFDQMLLDNARECWLATRFMRVFSAVIFLQVPSPATVSKCAKVSKTCESLFMPSITQSSPLRMSSQPSGRCRPNHRLSFR